MIYWLCDQIPSSDCYANFADDKVNVGVMMANNCCSSSSGSPTTWPACETTDQENQFTSLHGEYHLPQNVRLAGSLIQILEEPNRVSSLLYFFK